MITTVLFDMGGTLEDLLVDEESEKNAIEGVRSILAKYGMKIDLPYPELKKIIDDGWQKYSDDRDVNDEEYRPERIWGDYVLKPFDLPADKLNPDVCEEIAHMWEVTHYKRSLRPRVKEMLEGLKGLGMKLGVISNTASLYQVFDILKEYGIRDYFQDVTLSSVIGKRKPAPDMFRVSLYQVQSKPEECVYVGDTVSRDVVGSKRFGFAKAIQIGSFLTKIKDIGTYEYEPDYLIEDIYDVYTIVNDLVQGK